MLAPCEFDILLEGVGDIGFEWCALSPYELDVFLEGVGDAG